MVEKINMNNVCSLTELVKNTISMKLKLEPMFFSSYWESTLSKDASTSPDIMFRLHIYVLSCASFIKLIIYPIFGFSPPKGGFLFLLSLRITYIKQSKTRVVLKSNK